MYIIIQLFRNRVVGMPDTHLAADQFADITVVEAVGQVVGYKAGLLQRQAEERLIVIDVEGLAVLIQQFLVLFTECQPAIEYNLGSISNREKEHPGVVLWLANHRDTFVLHDFVEAEEILQAVMRFVSSRRKRASTMRKNIQNSRLVRSVSPL